MFGLDLSRQCPLGMHCCVLYILKVILMESSRHGALSGRIIENRPETPMHHLSQMEEVSVWTKAAHGMKIDGMRRQFSDYR